MRTWSVLFLLTTTFVASAADDGDPTMEALHILTKQCAGCHNKTGHPGRSFLEKANPTDPQIAARMLKMIETATMPPAHRDFRGTPEGKKVIAFLKQQKATKP